MKAGLLLAPGGEFAFVLFGEAVSEGIINSQMGSALFLVVAFSMATIPFLAQLGDFIASKVSKGDELTNLAPSNEDGSELSGHIIIAGFGRVGQMISQLMYENGIPFAAVDVRVEKVLAGRQLGLPVYFGDAGSPSGKLPSPRLPPPPPPSLSFFPLFPRLCFNLRGSRYSIITS